MSKTDKTLVAATALLVVVMLVMLVQTTRILIGKYVTPTTPHSVTVETSPDVFHSEGKVLLAPVGGPRPEMSSVVDADVLSVNFRDVREAREFYDEAVSQGESVCLMDMGELAANRWWLRTC